jgi:hypothetical protein
MLKEKVTQVPWTRHRDLPWESSSPALTGSKAKFVNTKSLMLSFRRQTQNASMIQNRLGFTIQWPFRKQP